MNCVKCNSDNVQRLEVIFDNGTSDINTKSGSTGIGFGRGGIGIGFGKTKTKGTSQSQSAIKASPPAKKKLWKFIALFVLGVFFTIDKNAGTGLILGGVAMMLIGGFFTYKNFTFNKKEYPELYKIWLDSWMCNKCGWIFRTN